jgi:hypothetical protein
MQKIISPSRCRHCSAPVIGEIVGSFVISPDGGRKYPLRRAWSELQRYDRIAAGYASHPSQRNKFFLLTWQTVAAKAALLHSCLDHQRMLMRRMQGRRSLLQIGPTSRTRDSVWFLFPCQDFHPTRNLSKLIPDPLRIFGPAHLFQLPRGMLQSVQRKCSRRILFRRAFASSLRPPPAATSLS